MRRPLVDNPSTVLSTVLGPGRAVLVGCKEQDGCYIVKETVNKWKGKKISIFILTGHWVARVGGFQQQISGRPNPSASTSGRGIPHLVGGALPTAPKSRWRGRFPKGRSPSGSTSETPESVHHRPPRIHRVPCTTPCGLSHRPPRSRFPGDGTHLRSRFPRLPRTIPCGLSLHPQKQISGRQNPSASTSGRGIPHLVGGALPTAPKSRWRGRFPKGGNPSGSTSETPESVHHRPPRKVPPNKRGSSLILCRKEYPDGSQKVPVGSGTVSEGLRSRIYFRARVCRLHNHFLCTCPCESLES